MAISCPFSFCRHNSPPAASITDALAFFSMYLSLFDRHNNLKISDLDSNTFHLHSGCGGKWRTKIPAA
jgi:hypothetical protein